jgi:excisionase family DNA binding protein
MDDLLTFATAARLLGVHPDDVRRWVRTEQCPVVAAGRARRIPASWVDAQRRKTPGQ